MATIFVDDSDDDRSCAGNLNTLQSAKIKERLNQIDRIREKGVGDHISLPQLVVCGAQSAGKSSVLEGITGIPFPRQDGVCTKFATEIILRHSPESASIVASIIPHSGRDEKQAENLRSFRRHLSGYEELPKTIETAAASMGIRGFGAAGEEAPAFAGDVLRIEVIGDLGLHLTIVDLPGIVSVDETGGKDIKLVEELVDSYLKSSRTIILAVVQATNDIVTEPIIQRTRRFDKSGERTVGIITKPDLINKGTEGRIALFTNNLDRTKLKLGYFLLKNPSPRELADGITPSERKRKEMEFFRSDPWKQYEIDLSRVGIEALTEFLEGLLENHIERELPKVRDEIEVLLEKTKSELRVLGEERSSIGDQRLFLAKLSTDLQLIIQATIDGSYQHYSPSFFGYAGEGASYRRLRARYHELNDTFATYMGERSKKRKIAAEDEESGEKETTFLESDDYSHFRKTPKCKYVRLSEFDAWVKRVYRSTRGRELPGNCNNILLTELFHEQSSRWPDIAKRHVKQVHEETASCVKEVLRHVIGEENVRQEMQKIANRQLQNTLDAALCELQKLCDDEKLQPITYNRHYTDNIQESRQSVTRAIIQEVVGSAANNYHYHSTIVGRQELISTLEKQAIVDMDQQACVEATAGLNSYYKVSMKTFVDNVCRQVVERHIARNVRNIFNPTSIFELSDLEVRRIASETHGNQKRRKELKTREKLLRESLWELSS